MKIEGLPLHVPPRLRWRAEVCAVGRCRAVCWEIREKVGGEPDESPQGAAFELQHCSILWPAEDDKDLPVGGERALHDAIWNIQHYMSLWLSLFHRYPCRCWFCVDGGVQRVRFCNRTGMRFPTKRSADGARISVIGAFLSPGLGRVRIARAVQIGVLPAYHHKT